jgi:hypothetical protein
MVENPKKTVPECEIINMKYHAILYHPIQRLLDSTRKENHIVHRK